MQLLEASSEIDVPAARAWQVLADLASYADWNPFIVAAEGELRVGEHLKVTLRAPDRPAVTFRPRILALEPGHLITWKGQWLLPGLFDGRHTLHVEPLGDSRCRFTTHEEVTGILLPLLGGIMRDSQRGFEDFAAAVKARAEETAANPAGS
jgi:hypothetical protein